MISVSAIKCYSCLLSCSDDKIIDCKYGCFKSTVLCKKSSFFIDFIVLFSNFKIFIVVTQKGCGWENSTYCETVTTDEGTGHFCYCNDKDLCNTSQNCIPQCLLIFILSIINSVIHLSWLFACLKLNYFCRFKIKNLFAPQHHFYWLFFIIEVSDIAFDFFSIATQWRFHRVEISKIHSH